MSRTTEKPKAAGKPATARKGAAAEAPASAAARARTRGTTLARSAAPRPATPRAPSGAAPSLAEARRRMQAGRTFWDALTPEQRVAGLDGPEVSGRAPTLARAGEP